MRSFSYSFRSFRLVFILMLGLGCGEGGDTSQPASVGSDPTPEAATGSSTGGAEGGEATEGGAVADGGDATPAGSSEGGDASGDGGDASADGADASGDGGDTSTDGAGASASGSDATGADGGAEGTSKESACGRLSRALEAVVTSEDPVAAATEGGMLVGENQVRVTVEMEADTALPDLGDGVTVELQSGARAQLLVPLDRLCGLGKTSGLKSIRSPNKPSTKKAKKENQP